LVTYDNTEHANSFWLEFMSVVYTVCKIIVYACVWNLRAQVDGVMKDMISRKCNLEKGIKWLTVRRFNSNSFAGNLKRVWVTHVTSGPAIWEGALSGARSSYAETPEKRALIKRGAYLHLRAEWGLNNSLFILSIVGCSSIPGEIMGVELWYCKSLYGSFYDR